MAIDSFSNTTIDIKQKAIRKRPVLLVGIKSNNFVISLLLSSRKFLKNTAVVRNNTFLNADIVVLIFSIPNFIINGIVIVGISKTPSITSMEKIIVFSIGLFTFSKIVNTLIANNIAQKKLNHSFPIT